MIIPENLLALLRCPRSGQELDYADAALLTKANTLFLNQGKPVLGDYKPSDTGAITTALVCTDRKFLYPIRDRIAILLVDEAISL